MTDIRSCYSYWEWSVKRFELSNGMATSLFKNVSLALLLNNLTNICLPVVFLVATWPVEEWAGTGGQWPTLGRGEKLATLQLRVRDIFCVSNSPKTDRVASIRPPKFLFSSRLSSHLGSPQLSLMLLCHPPSFFPESCHFHVSVHIIHLSCLWSSSSSSGYYLPTSIISVVIF